MRSGVDSSVAVGRCRVGWQCRRKARKASRVPALQRVDRQFNVLDNLDLSQKLSDDEFEKELAKQQSRLNMLQRRAAKRGVSTIIVFEGWDAAGKGGAIRRVTASLDARDYQVIPIAAPNDEERAHHYLWRFWRHLSRAGRLTDLRSKLVRPRARGTRGGVRHRGGVHARLSAKSITSKSSSSPTGFWS